MAVKAKEKETASNFTIFASRILASNKSWLNKNHFPCIKKKVGAFSAKQNGGGLLECCYEQCFRRVLIEERREESPCSPAVGVVGAESGVQAGGPSWGSRNPDGPTGRIPGLRSHSGIGWPPGVNRARVSTSQ
ncbi:unnamed protein product [Plutella xylostella]|uniref:(diamondback moth) hypothetical protein n=1 Tax=Plutella xylostella TaxID=51655 RepID=A0A8S4FZD2_PLUXY|nr:unnamed protein product [Plutella xylostella]